MKAKTYKTVCFTVSAIILVIVLALNVAVGVFSDAILDHVIGYKDAAGSGGSVDRAAGDELAEQIQREGTVLVKNEENILPLDPGAVSKVNVFGWASTEWVYSGSGSGQVIDPDPTQSGDQRLSLLAALKEYDIAYNPELETMYESFQGAREFGDALHSFNYEFSRLYEPSIDDNSVYTQEILTNALAYSDTALVVLGRITGESNDAPKVQYKKVSKNSSGVTDRERTYLEISTEEEALLKYVGENYTNVIVLINSTNVMELGFLDSIPGLDACMIVASTGTAGARAIPKLIFGEYNPSGRTTDTFAYDLSTSSTYANVGAGIKGNGGGEDTTAFYTNTDKSVYPLTTQHGNGSARVDYSGVAYTDYVESIYVGYKWYETADAMNFWSSSNAKTQWNVSSYNEVVQFPFGYGLSYTSFDWDIEYMSHPGGSAVGAKDEISIQVKVTNTGTVPGQDVVQLYYTPPYTPGGIEKASVNLLAFGKTQQVLKPGEYEIVELKFTVSDMKSYDCYDLNENGFAGYELEKGNYELTLRTDAHTLADDRLETAGDSATITYKIESDLTLPYDDATDNPVENHFTGKDATDGVAIDGNSDGTAQITYLSRENFIGTFPFERKANREMAASIRELNLYTPAMANQWIDPKDEPVTTGAANGSLVYDTTKVNGVDAGITELGIQLADPDNYDNEALWGPVLDCLTVDEMKNLVLHGYVKTGALESVGKPQTRDLDGPNQIGSFNAGLPQKVTGFSSIVLAQSWNVQLAYSMGMTIGTEAAQNSVSGWYGPGINIHRSPFGGRNWEYYSEDALLSGLMSAYSVKAAKNAGMFSYLKHICLYESESGRDGMYNWLTEQALREIYVKPFEISVKEGGATGIMTSYGRIGAVWTGGSTALLTELVRDEWGFKGAFLTDYADYHTFMNGDQMLRAGGDLWMDGYNNNGAFACETTSNSFMKALRNASKHVLYMFLDAKATNKDYNEKVANGETDGVQIITTSPERNFPWHIPVLIAVDVIAVGGCAVWIFLAIRKKDEAQPEPESDTPEE